MKCGHTANAVDQFGNPVCVICHGITREALEVADELPNLEGRTAKCDYCNNTSPSNFDLPFFEYRPNDKYDHYYCGCFGWD